MMGLPLLSSNPPPLSKEIKAKEVMSSGPLIVLPVVPRVREILYTLESTKHNGFPVVQVSWAQLYVLLTIMCRDFHFRIDLCNYYINPRTMKL